MPQNFDTFYYRSNFASLHVKFVQWFQLVRTPGVFTNPHNQTKRCVKYSHIFI